MAYTIWPRERDLTRHGDPITNWQKLEIVETYNKPGAAILTGTAQALDGIMPDMGLIIDDDQGNQIMSGNVAAINREMRTDPNTGQQTDIITIAIEDDLALLWSRIVFPDPNKQLTDGVPATFDIAYDRRNGQAETAIKEMINSHIGQSAQPARRDQRLHIPPTQGRGGQVAFEARFNILGEVAAKIAEQTGHRITISHDETAPTPRLAFGFDPITDVSDNVIFGTDPTQPITGHVSDWTYSITAPTATIAIVAAQGSMTDRQIIAIGPAIEAEQLWGSRREMLVDQRQADATDATGMTEAINNGRARLREAESPTTISFNISDSTDITYGTDYSLGDLVTVMLPGLPSQVERIREVTTTLSETGTIRRITVGSPNATDNNNQQAIRIAAALTQIRNLERN